MSNPMTHNQSFLQATKSTQQCQKHWQWSVATVWSVSWSVWLATGCWEASRQICPDNGSSPASVYTANTRVWTCESDCRSTDRSALQTSEVRNCDTQLLQHNKHFLPRQTLLQQTNKSVATQLITFQSAIVRLN